jgi:hypothetical protein
MQAAEFSVHPKEYLEFAAKFGQKCLKFARKICFFALSLRDFSHVCASSFDIAFTRAHVTRV